MIGRRRLLAGILLLAMLADADASIYRQDGAKGWWWYEDPPLRQEAEPAEEPKQQTLPDHTPEVLWNMDSDRLRDYAEQVTKEAVRLPSEANVLRHYVVQDVIRRKAAAFTNASELIWQQHPELTVAKDLPLAAPGRNALTREMVEERERLLDRSREDFALLYFTSASCPFCQEQEAILAHFRERFGWTVKPIDVERQTHLAERFGIQTTPSLLLIRRGSRDFLPVTAGVASASEIEARLYRGIRLLLGEVTPENFNLYDFQKGGGFDVESGR